MLQGSRRAMPPMWVLCIFTLASCSNSTLAQPAVIRSADETISVGVGEIGSLTPKHSKSLAQFRLIEHPGYRTPLHVHDVTDETFFVLEGSLTLFVDGQHNHLGPGDYVFLPRGTPHAQGNLSNDPVVLLTTLVPGDFAAFFHDRAELVKNTPPEHPDYGDRMRELGTKHDIRILGPTPF